MKKLLVVIMLSLLAACSASNMSQLEKTKSGEVKTVLHSHNTLLWSRIGVTNIITGHAGDLLKAQATLTNRWKFKLDFQYQFKWFDADGFELAPEGQTWRQLVMAGRTQANVQALAPDPRATRFEIWVQE